MKKICKWLSLLLTILLFVPTQVFAAEAIQLQKDVSLTIDYADGTTPLPGAAFSLYYVATVDAYNYSEFTLTEAFADSKVVINNMTSEGWHNAARTLAAYAQRNSIPTLDSGKTGTNGMLTFPTSDAVTMKPGLYLVVGSRYAYGGKTYTPDPFLVSLPVLDENANAWDYSGTVKPKVEPIPDTPIIPGTIDRKVIKVWDDKGYEFARPNQIQVTLLRDGVPYDTVILNEGNNWTHRWNGLDPKYTWTVVEDTVPGGYTVTIGQQGITFVITNTYHPDVPTTDKKVVKIWDDGGHTDKRPSGIVVELLKNGQVYDTVTLGENNNWSYHWQELDPDARWEVREKYIPDGYTATITEAGNTFVLTNTYRPEEETTTATVVKTWVDSGFENDRPDTIAVELWKDGVLYDTVYLSAAAGWRYQWDKLPLGSYTVVEPNVPAQYTAEVTANGNTFVITNTHEISVDETPVERSVLKLWQNDEAHLAERPDSIQAALLRDGEVYEIVTLSEANGWRYHWTGLEAGHEWTVVEYTTLDKYTCTIARDGDTFVLVNQYSDIPQTGQLWWPVPILLCGGLTCIVVGLLRRRHGYDET